MGEGIHTIRQKTDRSYLHDTDGGMNRQEAFKVNQLESRIRNRKTEKGYVVDSNGNVIAESIKGSRSAATFRKSDLAKAKDAILTHNHPNAEMGGTLAAQIGLPFSHTDLKGAVEYDIKEVRAATPNYTYSIRRPKGGWGDTREINRVLDQWNADRNRNYYAYTNAPYRMYSDWRESWDRGNVVGQWQAWKDAVKKLGWTITRKRVSS